MAAYLVDTCVWRDFYEDRISRSGADIGKYATEFFMKVLKRKDKMLFSKELIRELRADYDSGVIEDMLMIFMHCDILIRIDISLEQFLEAKRLSRERNIPLTDCLNAIQARDNDAILITRDIHYFKDLKDITNAIRPEDSI